MGKRKTVKPVNLGDGKFCYSGPTCRIHSSFNSQTTKNETSLEPVKKLLELNLDQFKKEETQWMCSQELSLNTLDDYQEYLM